MEFQFLKISNIYFRRIKKFVVVADRAQQHNIEVLIPSREGTPVFVSGNISFYSTSTVWGGAVLAG